MNKYAVIFDMDGVICHTNPYHAKAFEAFFKKYNIESNEREFEEHMYGKHNSYIMQHFFKRPISPKELIDLESEKEALFRTIYKDEISPINGYLEFLEELKSNDFKTGVATSAPRQNMNLILDALDIRSKMGSLLCSEDVTLHKPHPEVYLKSADNLQVDPKNCIVFEDSFSGITAGINAGMTVVAVLSTHTKQQLPPCPAYINDYTEISVSKILELKKGLDY
ncbi:HAD family hydrolase [Sphingobacterium sp. SG20118]|uniref:HAD family hydrolase n=1 Tax=Sphingobacterium TaxID=28453 RepID=UPI0004F85330|nr:MULTISPECIES: HAD family phosphatase [Sphingobacterium]AIM36257.1 haloacid dehalogenase [Sphingobacterium sp. ML3W]MDH5827617.1 HAD family phosphatase [Sphingobacterium faecium]